EVTLFDYGILTSNFGLLGAEEFAGSAQSASGNFSATLRVVLGDWTAQTERAVYVLLQFKRAGTESDPDTPIYEQVVQFGQNEVEKDVSVALPEAGVYTVRALAYNDAGRTDVSHWLRSEAIVPSAVPWIFAAPTGVDKVTVYWDPVPGATGYRVRWGTVSGSYPNVSPDLPASSPYRYSVTGLVSEQEYYFVIEAKFGDVVGVPSEEDSAVPHAGAIPWDTQDPNQIIPALRSQMELPYGYLVVLSPDGLLYTEDGWERRVQTALYRLNPQAVWVEDTEGNLLMPLQTTRDAESGTGPFRRVSTKPEENCIGCEVMFYIPPPAFIYSRFINVPTSTFGDTRDTPHIYLGLKYGRADIEGGIAFHPSGRGVRDRTGREWTLPPGPSSPGIVAPNYDRWQPYLKVGNRSFPIASGSVGETNNHIRYDDAPYGLVAQMSLRYDATRKGVHFRANFWYAELQDPTYEDASIIYDFYGFADVKPVDRFSQVIVRRVVSIAQLSTRVGTNGYRLTGSFFEPVGVGYQPLFSLGDLPFPAMVYSPAGQRLWTWQVSAPPTNFPASGDVVIADERNPYFSEIIYINLR
ncbi:MAG: fibronectin type III domain-containing protein, partial [Armatimonadota bacterium]